MATRKKDTRTKKNKLSEEAYQHMLEYQYAYNKRVYKQYLFRLNIEKDAALVEFLAGKPNWSKYVLDLVREDMKKSSE